MRPPFRTFQRQPRVRINQFIRAPEVFVIDPDGKPLGVMSAGEAQAAARARMLDLVEVAPNAKPPVCKILDYGKYKYEQAKKEKDSKKGSVGTSKLKELQLHLNIDAHDYQIKLKQAEGFLLKGMKVRFNLLLRGRENIHKELAVDLMRRVREDLGHVATADQEIKPIGRSIVLMLLPLPAQKRTHKYTKEGEAETD
ncbi:Translation initiation factor IF-3 [Methylacidimicrobium cyclopophantes]|uniref:Translation initiation factor IF-3 n=1 Tax=Methylacidimicrobium cyclopophantes TaxID=1041766 RepID=A0A5E6M7Z6_9BACT|nr:translation initiation factor IF-3 [Methylacidimicrobium cyclopophantes]VVM05680.1 Translation initiation factor IF-3 [Methylacidimicrobium cyclopophantes]